MSDVTAVVLTTGEAYTERALDGIARQSEPVAETVVVRGVSPFHAAVNHGAARVQTTFFIQVDADMILDETCVESLRAAMAPTLAIIAGLLRDALLGRVLGVKMYRTACLRTTPLADVISPDTDVASALRARGWGTARALNPASRHTFGTHGPEYTTSYTYVKFLATGARHRYRGNGRATRALFRRLCESDHPAAAVAVAALAHGLFLQPSGDLLDASHRPRLPAVLERRTERRPPHRQSEALQWDARAPLEEVLAQGYRFGLARRDLCLDDLRAPYERLRSSWSVPAWLATVGFFHGALSEREAAVGAQELFVRLAPLLSDADSLP